MNFLTECMLTLEDDLNLYANFLTEQSVVKLSILSGITNGKIMIVKTK